MRKLISGAALACAFMAAGALCAGPDDILGNWKTENAKSVVSIFKCGPQNDKYCGSIVSLAEPNYPANDEKGMGGKPKVDRNNPDASRRNNPIIGLFLMWGFSPDGDGKWANGQIYDPESGKIYSCKMSLKNPGTLEVRGFVGVSFLGRTSVWTR